MKADSFDVVKDVQQVGLDGVGVRGLAKDLQQGGVRDKKEPRKQQSLLLQIAERQYKSLTNLFMKHTSGFFNVQFGIPLVAWMHRQVMDWKPCRANINSKY